MFAGRPLLSAAAASGLLPAGSADDLYVPFAVAAVLPAGRPACGLRAGGRQDRGPLRTAPGPAAGKGVS